MTTYTSHYPPSSNDTHVKATDTLAGGYYPYQATDPSKSLTGVSTNNAWVAANNIPTKKFCIDHGSAFVAARVYLENYHYQGLYGTSGIKTFRVYGTNSATAFANIASPDDLTDLTLLGEFVASQHVSSDTVDPQYFLITGNTTAYRYTVIRLLDYFSGGSYLAFRRIEIQSADSAVTLRAVLRQPYELEIDIRRSVLDQLYPLTNSFFAKLDQIWGLRMLASLDMPYGNMPMKRAVLHMPLEDCKQFRRTLPMEYGDARQYRAVLDNEWNLSAGLRAILVERYSIADHQVRGAFEQLYALQSRDLLRSMLNQIYAMAAGLALVQRYEIEVTCDGQPITSMININIEQDEGLFHMSGELQLADQAEFLLFREHESEVEITINDETFFFLPEKTRKSRPETGVNVYIVPLASPTLLLDSPHTTPITGTFSGMAKSIVENLSGSTAVNWQLVDWFIPSGKLAANSEPPISIIKKIVSAAGGVVQTSPAGVLVCRPEYPVSVNLWSTTEPDIELTDQDDFFSLDPQPELRDGYNEFFVSDQQLTSGGLRKETEKTGDYTALIRVYQVPWNNTSIVRDYHSGGDWVSLVANGVVEETITEQIEIIEGAGQVSKPCYQELSHEYRQVDLGDLTITEAGEVTSATAGYSLVIITYITRNWQFVATDYRDEDVQFYAEAI